ncbi:MAG: hypothetical protein E6K78_04790 [Candidatus Eisenbacteria bacterium]|uniref:Zinc-finger domain-containing protein n=1 Tax=Eiseniibacteriota bacterium TaxID=2212470 RepID=A0A538TUW7_UNCEI|nr:MAG: hypothetical protein E6K78_04790 [Candidatus Eisenbacteria bacterium]
MTCDQFERWLDQGTPAPLAAVASAHAQRCARCAASRSASRELDALLRSAPRAPDPFTERVMDHLETPGIALLPAPLPWWIRAASEPAGVLALALAAALLWGWQRLWSFTETAAPAAVRVVEASLAAWVAELIAAPRLGPLRAPQVQVGLEVALSCLVLLASPALYRTTARITARVLPRTPVRAC